MRYRALVVLKGAAGIEFEKEVAALAIDEERRVARPERHQMREMTETTNARTMEMTTIQMTARTNFLLCMLFE